MGLFWTSISICRRINDLANTDPVHHLWDSDHNGRTLSGCTSMDYEGLGLICG